ncbi:MAG: aldo/keto reductase [Anaerolineales bacterium]|nr:aldo/keto reductase [Anaerolineales bacterium]
MEYRNLGRTGLKVSPLCMGSMQFGWSVEEADAFRILTFAYDRGINFIDTADVYSRWVEGNPGGVSETIIGRWLKKNNIPRDQIVIATKVRSRLGNGPNDEGLSRYHIMNGVEASLCRLQLDCIDLYQAHWPDDSVSSDETLRAFDDLVRQGKVRYIGCSNYNTRQLMEALWTSDKLGLARFDSLQPHYSMVRRDEFERELRSICQKLGLGVIPYSPLAAGFLTGKYRRESRPESVRQGSVQKYFTDRNWKLLDILDTFSAEKGASVSQVALAWLLSDAIITSPIIGPRTLEQLEDNLGALGIALDPEEKSRLDQASAWQPPLQE